MDHTKTPGVVDTAEIDARLEQAREHLKEFEGSASTADLLARLRAVAPLHPFLVVRALAMAAMGAAAVATVASLAVPLLDRSLAQLMVQLEAASGLPVPAALGILTVCAAAVLFTAQLAATSAARNVAFRPNEAKAHQRLMSEVRQLEAQKAVKERMTPPGPATRVVAR